MSDIEKTLKERGDRYGSFVDHAKIAQALQDTMRGSEGWGALAADQKQALTVIADKIARMLNGQPNYRDNWHDIVGYAKLVDDRLADEESKEKNEFEEEKTSHTFSVKSDEHFKILYSQIKYGKPLRIQGLEGEWVLVSLDRQTCSAKKVVKIHV